jgi:hypothetical protein
MYTFLIEKDHQSIYRTGSARHLEAFTAAIQGTYHLIILGSGGYHLLQVITLPDNGTG